MNQITKVHASLFSGFGASDLAATWMNWNNAFWCEIDDFPRTVLSYWFPKSIGYGNIKETDFTPWRGKINVLTGGFPCQPFSVAGQRKGANDDRYLWPEFKRAIREIQPDWVIGENVGGIISMVQPGSEVTVESQTSLFEESNKETILNQEYVVETVCRDLEQEGYSVQPIIIPACAVGAPHRRDRVWFIAHRNDAPHSDLDRCRNGKNKQEQLTQCKGTPYNCFSGKDGIAPDTNGKRCNNRSDNRKERPFYYDWKRYSKEDQSERNERKCRTCENSAFTTDPECQRSRQIHKEIQSEKSNGYSINCNGDKWNASDTNQFDGNLSGFYSSRLSQFKASAIRNDTYPYCQRCQKRFTLSESDKQRLADRTSYAPRRDWQNFPTQSPVCRGNDGIPFDVVRLTIPFNKWREGSVKGYGNAIVPQVIFEIFKAIEEIEQSK